MAPFDGQPTQRQQIALALAPKFAASLSILGSSYIVRDCISASKRKQLVYHRLMLGLCVCDILMSVGLFTSTWPMPSATPNVWGASGTVASCEAVGFIEQAGVSATMYNGSLSIYYLLRVRYNWNQGRLKFVILPMTNQSHSSADRHGPCVTKALWMQRCMQRCRQFVYNQSGLVYQVHKQFSSLPYCHRVITCNGSSS